MKMLFYKQLNLERFLQPLSIVFCQLSISKRLTPRQYRLNSFQCFLLTC